MKKIKTLSALILFALFVSIPVQATWIPFSVEQISWSMTDGQTSSSWDDYRFGSSSTFVIDFSGASLTRNGSDWSILGGNWTGNGDFESGESWEGSGLWKGSGTVSDIGEVTGQGYWGGVLNTSNSRCYDISGGTWTAGGSNSVGAPLDGGLLFILFGSGVAYFARRKKQMQNK